MDKAKFNEKYPDGLNNTIWLFKKALDDIMTSDEIDKVIKYSKGSEKRHLKKFKESYLASGLTSESINIWPVLSAIKSAELLKNVISFMAVNDKNIDRGE